MTPFALILVAMFAAAAVGSGVVVWLIARVSNDDAQPKPAAERRQLVTCPPRRAGNPLGRALQTIPGACVFPPEQRSGHGVIVLSGDEALIEATRAAVRSVRGREILLVAGVAHDNPLTPPGSHWRGLWAYSYRDGELAGSEPVCILPANIIFRRPRPYWLVAPQGGWTHAVAAYRAAPAKEGGSQ